MDGWIIKNSKGQFLVRSQVWRPNKNAAGMFFTEADLETLRSKAKEEGVDTSDLLCIPASLEHGRVVSRNGWARSL